MKGRKLNHSVGKTSFKKKKVYIIKVIVKMQTNYEADEKKVGIAISDVILIFCLLSLHLKLQNFLL